MSILKRKPSSNVSKRIPIGQAEFTDGAPIALFTKVCPGGHLEVEFTSSWLRGTDVDTLIEALHTVRKEIR